MFQFYIFLLLYSALHFSTPGYNSLRVDSLPLDPCIHHCRWPQGTDYTGRKLHLIGAHQETIKNGVEVEDEKFCSWETCQLLFLGLHDSQDMWNYPLNNNMYWIIEFYPWLNKVRTTRNASTVDISVLKQKTCGKRRKVTRVRSGFKLYSPLNGLDISRWIHVCILQRGAEHR